MRKLPIVIVLAVIALLLSLASSFTVYETEQVIITRFGEPRQVVTKAGLHFKWPLIEKVHSFEKRILPWDGERENMPTKDKKRIEVDVWARWRIVDAMKFYQAVNSVRGGQKILDDLVDSSVRDIIASHNLIECVRSSNDALRYETEELGAEQERSPEQVTLGRAELERQILESVRGSSDLKVTYGMEVTEFRIKRVDYIDSVRDQVYERMKSERTRIARLFESEADEQRNRILGNTRKELDEIEGDMEGRAAEIRGQADAEVIKIYADAIGQDLDFYAFMRQLEAYKATLGSGTKLLLSTDNEFLRRLRGPDESTAEAKSKPQR